MGTNNSFESKKEAAILAVGLTFTTRSYMLSRKLWQPSSPSQPQVAQFSSALTTKQQLILFNSTEIITSTRGVPMSLLHNSDYWAGRSAQFGAPHTAELLGTNTQTHSQNWEPPIRSHANTPLPPRSGSRCRREPNYCSAGNRSSHSPSPRLPFQPICIELTGQTHMLSGVFSATGLPPIHTRTKPATRTHVAKIYSPPTISYENIPYLPNNVPR